MASDPNARDLKLIQYLNEAYGKEKQLETALTAHIGMTSRDSYRKRLQDHLKETRTHARGVERRIKQLGGTPETVNVPGPDAVSGAAQAVQNVANRAAALAQGPLHAMRGTGEQEKLLKNAKTEYQDEAEEIATYTAIEALAETVGDRETAKLAKGIRRQEERMAKFLERLIPTLTKAVAQDEIPAALRNGGSRRRSAGRRAAGSSARASSNGAKASSGRSASKTAPRSRTAAKKSVSRSRSGGSTRARASSSRTRAAATKSGRAARTTRARSTAARSSSRGGASARGRSSSRSRKS